MTNKELTDKFIDLSEKSVLYMEKLSNVMKSLNDNNRLHAKALEVNTNATQEMTKSFNRIWYILWIVIVALIVLAGAEKVLKFL